MGGVWGAACFPGECRPSNACCLIGILFSVLSSYQDYRLRPGPNRIQSLRVQVVGMIGCVIMPHNLFLHSALVQSRVVQTGGEEEAIGLFTIESTVAILRLAPLWAWERGGLHHAINSRRGTTTQATTLAKNPRTTDLFEESCFGGRILRGTFWDSWRMPRVCSGPFISLFGWVLTSPFGPTFTFLLVGDGFRGHLFVSVCVSF